MLSDELTAGGIRASNDTRRLRAQQSLEFNFKKEKEFVELFGALFPLVGIDGNTKTAIQLDPNEESKQQAQATNPTELLAELREKEKVENDQNAQVMSTEEFDNFLVEMKGNN